MLLFLSMIFTALVLFGICLGAVLALQHESVQERPLLRWALRALDEDVPLEVLADALPYSGAGELEAMALVDHLADAGWSIVPSYAGREGS